MKGWGWAFRRGNVAQSTDSLVPLADIKGSAEGCHLQDNTGRKPVLSRMLVIDNTSTLPQVPVCVHVCVFAFLDEWVSSLTLCVRELWVQCRFSMSFDIETNFQYWLLGSGASWHHDYTLKPHTSLVLSLLFIYCVFAWMWGPSEPRI